MSAEIVAEDRSPPPTTEGERLRALLQAGMVLTSELSLDAVLDRLLQIAAELTGARYAALGVVAPGGARLERFVTHGLDAETKARIGEPPRGRGILGALLSEPKPLRLHDLAGDPRAVGVPEHHPPMHSFLGVPLALRGVAYGNLYLTEKEGGADFTAEDEELVGLLAAQAVVAIENARLYEASTRWSARLESLTEVGNALVGETDLDTLLDLVATRLRDLLGARTVSVLLPAGADRLRYVAVAGDSRDQLLGVTLSRGESKSGRVFAGLRGERVDSLLDDPEVDLTVTRLIGARTGIWVPLVAQGESLGVLAAHDKIAAPDGRFGDDDLRLAETFAIRAAVAVELSGRNAREALRRIVAAQETDRRRLAVELHDETAQALTSILLGLKALERCPDPAAAGEAVATLREQTVAILKHIRSLAVELHPKVLDDFGLTAALERLVETWQARTGIPVELVAHLDEAGLPPEIATTLYRIVQEALTNIVKHARARRVSILLSRKNGEMVIAIEDDGQGFDPSLESEGLGLDSIRERAALAGGRLQVESTPGAGTTIAIEVPLP